MNLVQHYNDLTEVNELRVFTNFAVDLAALEKKIITRIAFTDAKDSYETPKRLLDAGWTIAKKTLDWHDSHHGDSGVNLFYKIFPENVSDVNDKQTRKRSTYSCHHSLSGSCSMGLWDKLDKDWIVNMARSWPERYITLIRLDRKRTKEEIAKMRYYRYKLVFKSDVARYFCNGWSPEEWPGVEGDRAFWATPKAPKKNGFIYKPPKES